MSFYCSQSKGILDQLVIVPSTSQHLRSLALAVTCGEPVLLQGPVGCGKTCLVEHLAAMAGHKLVKIQLGDQTDSKVDDSIFYHSNVISI